MRQTQSIDFKDVGVNFPIFNAKSYSLKNKILTSLTGGILKKDNNNITNIQALQNINIKINNGERVGLIGDNGSGKSTFLRVCSRIYKPTTGSIDIQGKITSLININLGIDPDSNGRENIRLRLILTGFSPKEIEKVTNKIIEFSGLGEFINFPFSTYSSGMQLRLAFATSTFINPEILIMDEWLSTGDKDFQEKSEKKLNELVEKTGILVIASHSKDLLLKVCNRIIWLERGKIKLDGSPQNIIKEYFS
jgi:lipopolysaccharide transport system ATP-binding protein